MELIHFKTRVKDMLVKYRFAAIILIAGIALLLLPLPEKANSNQETEIVKNTEETVEERLADILSLVKGAGKTEVLLTLSAGEETVYQIDEETNTDDSSTKTKITTITITDKERNTAGLIRQVIPARYLGAIVVCQGADDPAVKLMIVEAVSKLTGLGADKISVMKMK